MEKLNAGDMKFKFVKTCQCVQLGKTNHSERRKMKLFTFWCINTEAATDCDE